MNNFMQVDQTTWVKCIKSLKHTPPKLALQETGDQRSSSPVAELTAVAEPAPAPRAPPMLQAEVITATRLS